MRKFFAILTLVFAACLFTRSATITGPIYLAYSNRPYSGKILIRPLSTPLPYSPNLVTGGDFTVSTDTNGLFSVDLQPGNYRVQVGADRAFTIDVPTNAATYTLLERITNALSWNSSIIPATNSYQSALTTRAGVVKTTSDQVDPVAWLTNDTATIGRWLGSVTAGTIDELIATTAPTYDVDNIVVNGWVTEQDGRGGDWYYDYGATTTTNTGMVVAWGSGRLLRKWGTEVLPQWFGANDSASADAAPALQAAIDFAARPTYGWQGYAGQSSTPLSPDDLTKYNGCFKVKCVGAFALYSTVYLRDGVLLEGKPGSSSGDFGGNTIFHIWHGGIGFIVEVNRVLNGNRIGGMRDLTFACLAHTYQPNKKTITAVTDRFTFKVADADAPPTLDDTTLRPANNTCFFFDPNGEYLGSARISSTSSSSGQTTVNLFNDGTDAFSSINGTAGSALTTDCKVVWPVRVSDEYTSLGAFNDPGLAGTVAVSVRNTSSATITGTPLIENLHAWGFHSAFRFGPGILWSGAPMRDLRSGRHKFAGISFARPDNTTDFVISGGTIFQGYYALDFSQVLSSNSPVSVSATSPAVFTKTGHGYKAGSRIRFGATGSMPGGISSGTGYPGTGYYVQATGLTADTFQVSTSFIGTSVNASSTGSGVYIAGNVIDQPALQHGTYGIFNAPTFSRWDSTIAEFSSYANVYASRIIGPHFKYLFCDGSLRHGLVLGAGYNAFVSPTSSALTDWVGVDHLIVKPGLPGSPYDTLHTNSVAVYFEKPLDTARFAGAAIGTFSAVRSETGGPQFTHAFDLQPTAYNNRAKIGLIAENNGYAAWRNPTGVAPEIDTPNLTAAADIDTGWYRPSATQRDFAVSGTRLLSLTSGNLLVEKAGGSSLFTLKNTTSGTTVATTVGTGTLTWDNTADSLRLGTVYSDSGQATLFLGSSGTAGTTRASFIKAESAASGVTDKAAGTFYIFGSGGTGSSTTGGDIQFWTFDAGSSGTAVQSSSAKVRIPRVGGIYLPGQASDPSATAAGHFFYSSGARGFRFYDGSYWQPLSVHSDEVSVASASTVNLGFQSSDKVYITGTTTINSFGAALGGTRRNVRFEGALTLTYNATSMVLPTGSSIATAAGDTLEAVCISTGNWRVIWYQRASGHALAGGGGGGGGGGSGDVVGPASATDNAVVRFDGTTGKLVQNSAVTIADSTGDITAGKYNTVAISGSSTPTLAVTGTASISGSNTGDQSGANPTASVGLTAVNGSASTFLRSDGAPALDQSIAPTWTGAHTFSKNGALSLPTFSITGTPITGGTATTTKPLALIETAGATSTAWSTSGTMLGINAPSGFSGRPLEVQVNGVSALNLTAAGTLTVAANIFSGANLNTPSTGDLVFSTRGRIDSPADGVLTLKNNAETDFTRLQLGGTSTSFPAIERSGTTVAIKLADGSADAPLTASNFNKVTLTPPATGSTLTIADGKTLTANNTLTLTATDGSTLAIGTGGTLGTAAYTASTAYQPVDADLTAIAGLTSAADKGIQFTGAGTAATYDLTTAGKALLDDADASAQRTTLGLGTVATESTVPVAKGGTGATTASAARDALSVAETTVASATTTDLGAVASDKVSITGTTTITSFGTVAAGVKREGRFTGALTLTHNATSLIIPGGASLTTAAGDRFGAYSLGSGNWVVTWYTKADGTAVVGGSGSVATDTIWDAAGDLAVGTGSNTAARLAAGDYGAVLTSGGLAATPYYAAPNNSFTVFEQFLSHLASATIFSEVFSGVSSTAGTSHDKDHPGVYSISTGSSASSTGYLRVGNSSGMIMVGGGILIYEQAIRIPTLSDGSQTFSAHFGFAEAGYIASTGGNHHIKFIHDSSSGNWIISTKNNGTAGNTTTGTAVSTGWQKIRIVVNADASSVSFFVNGTEVSGSPITSNIPNNTDSMSFGWGMTKSVGTTARTVDTDYVWMHQKLTNPL